MEYENPHGRSFGPDDEEDVNPYASPGTSCSELNADRLEPDVRGVWRDGDTMVVLRFYAVTPNACWVTNRERFVRSFEEAIDTDFQQAIEFIVFWIPLVAFAFLPVLASRRSAAVVSIRLRRWNCAYRGCMQILAFCLWLTGNGLAGIALLLGAWLTLFIGYFLMLIAFMLFTSSGSPVKMKVVDGFIRIRGVHPDYLARLDDFATWEANN